MHRRLGVETVTVELKTAKELLATLASDRIAIRAQPLEAGVVVPTARETWTTAELSEVDPDLTSANDGRRPAYGGSTRTWPAPAEENSAGTYRT